MQRDLANEAGVIEPERRKRYVFSGSVLGFADCAVEGDISDSIRSLKNGTNPFVIAGLAKVMRSWGSLPSDCAVRRLLALVAVNEIASSQVDERVPAAILKGPSKADKFFSVFDHVALQLKQLRVVKKKAFLGLKQLVVDLANGRCIGVEIPDAKGSVSSFLGEFERGYRVDD